MAKELFIPKLGQTVEEVSLVSWLVEDGAKVDFGQAILEVETDKAIFPVESNAKGYLHRGPYQAGDVLPVLAVVATIGKPEEHFITQGGSPATPQDSATNDTKTLEAPVAESLNQSSGASQPGKVFASPRAKKLASQKDIDLTLVTPSGGGGIRVAERDVLAYLQNAQISNKITPKASPLAQKIAAVEGVDLETIAGTGPGGKIIKSDVERSLDESRKAPILSPASAPAVLSQAEVVERLPLKGVRAIIADRMSASVHTTARVTMLMEVDATELVAFRTRIKTKVEKEWGFTPSYNDILAQICAAALKKHPNINARLAPDAVEILRRINIGIAVDTDRGLLVPVCFDVDQKNLKQIASESKEKIERARAGRSLPDELSGGTFTITNLGMFEIDAFTPVINLPEAAILGVGRIIAKPVVKEDQVKIRQMMTLSLAFDHRLIDGAPAARFLQTIKQLIEEPYLLLI